MQVVMEKNTYLDINTCKDGDTLDNAICEDAVMY